MVKINEFDLLSFEPIYFNGLKIYKPTLTEIRKMGRENFNGITNLLCLQEKDLKKQLSSLFPKDLVLQQKLYVPYNFFIKQSENVDLSNNLIFLKLQLAFITYTKRNIKILNGNIIALANHEEEQDFIFSTKTFEDFQHIIRLINCWEVQEKEEPEIQTDNLEMKKKFEEKRRLLKEAKKREKEVEGEGLTLEQIISYVCAFPASYNMTNVWNLTIYQLLNQFQILQLKEGYDHKIILLSSGVADEKKLDVKYWIKTEKN